ncbi:MAG: fluoride efflux transporter FluC [Actinomycetota bacterium]
MLQVALLGGVGALIRFGLSWWDGKLPWGILLANLLGSFTAGVAIELGDQNHWIAVGLAGGISTFSTFAGQTGQLWTKGEKGKALINGLLNLFLSALAFLTASFLL